MAKKSTYDKYDIGSGDELILNEKNEKKVHLLQGGLDGPTAGRQQACWKKVVQSSKRKYHHLDKIISLHGSIGSCQNVNSMCSKPPVQPVTKISSKWHSRLFRHFPSFHRRCTSKEYMHMGHALSCLFYIMLVSVRFYAYYESLHWQMGNYTGLPKG